MKLYVFLDRFFPRYSWKFLFVAFAGTHIPLIGLIIYQLMWSENTTHESMFVILFLVGFTLVAFVLTVYLLSELIQPVRLARQGLLTYAREQRVPSLPTDHRDEIGVLMRDLRQNLEALDQNRRQQEEVIAILSHDLRSPAAAISSLASLALLEEQRSDVNPYLNQINQLTREQLLLMDAMLLNLREQHGKVSSVPVQPVLWQTLRQLRQALHQKNLTVESKIPDELTLTVPPSVLGRILTNLIGNAAKFSEGGGKIKVTGRSQGGQGHLSVTDQGVGFEPAQADKLFLQFTPLGRPGTAGEPSNGLGLYLSRQMAEAHGGTLTAESQGPDKGATFTLSLPLAS